MIVPPRLTVGIGTFTGIKRSGCGVHHPPPFNTKVKERIQLYLYCPSVPSRSVLGKLHLCLYHHAFPYHSLDINPLTPNDLYISRTTPLTSKRCILYIYSTNVGTEYFKHALYSPFFLIFKMQFVS